MLDPTERQTLIRQLRKFPLLLAAEVKDLTAEQMTTPYLAGEWTVAQNVHHLADSHMHSFIRMKLILSEDRPTFRTYDQDIWATLPDGTGAEVLNTLELLTSLHRRWTDLLEALPEEAWSRVGVHPVDGDITLAGMLQNYVQHGNDHIDQIQRTLAAGGLVN